VGAALSALTKNQVIAFVLTAAVCFLFTVSGSSIVLGFLTPWAPAGLVDWVSSFSFLTHFSAIVRGVIDLRDAVFFLSVILFFLYANALVVELKKAD
jgi:ABC-2 type transport system permease protein